MTLVKLNQAKNKVANYSPFNDLFDSFFSDSYLNDKALYKSPAVNISETDDGFEIELAAPGLNKTDFKLNLDQNLLTISADKKVEKTNENNRKLTLKEFSYTSFSRAFTLPEQADINNIKATYESGILYVNIGKKETAKFISKEISVS